MILKWLSNGELEVKEMMEKPCFLLPLFQRGNLINITEGSFSRLFHLVLRLPEVQIPLRPLRNVRNSWLPTRRLSNFPPKGPGPSAQWEVRLQRTHGKEQRLLQVGKVQIFGLFFLQEEKCFNLPICFVSTQFAAFFLLGWEMVIWDLKNICVPEWSQSMLAWREMCYLCCSLWRSSFWLKGTCCDLLLKLQESSIEQPTALAEGQKYRRENAKVE